MNRGVFDRPRVYDVVGPAVWTPCIVLRKGTVIRSITFMPLAQACTTADARLSDVISLGGLRFTYLIANGATPGTGEEVIAVDRWMWIPLASGATEYRVDELGDFVGDNTAVLGGNTVRLPINFRVPEALDGQTFWLYETAHDCWNSKCGVVFEVDELE